MRRLESWIVPWLAVCCTLALSVIPTRPSGYILPILEHIAGAFAIYLFTPFLLPAIAAVLVGFAIADVAVFIASGTLQLPQITLLIVSFAFTNAMGYLTSRRLNILRRQDFVGRLVERRARRTLMTQIAERKRVEQELEKARLAAETANAAKSAFLASMSHEIRTPLTGVLGFAQLLGETPLTGAQREHLDVIERSGRTLTRLLNDILDLSKVEAGRLAIENGPFDVVDAVVQTVRLTAAKAGAKGVQLRLQGPEKESAIWLLGDPDRLQQVLGNLLENALKYAKRSDIDITLQVEAEENGKRQVRLEVLDRGPGIPDRDKERIFEPYILGTTQAHDGSAGLGLAICRRIVQLMGGTIAVKDREGGGSQFIVELALACAEPRSSGRNAVLPPVNEHGPALDVLLVDDDEVNRLLISTVLARHGHRVEMAADGRQGVDAALARRFDVILMDMRMPVMDGLEAISFLRGRKDGPNASAPIFAMTANVMESHVAAYRQAGANGVIAKPVNFVDLQRQLERIAAQREARPSPPESGERILIDSKTLDQIVETLGEEGAMKAEAQFRDSAPLLLRALGTARDPADRQRFLKRLTNAAESLGLVEFAQAAVESGAGEDLDTLLTQSLDALAEALRRARRKDASLNADAG